MSLSERRAPRLVTLSNNQLPLPVTGRSDRGESEEDIVCLMEACRSRRCSPLENSGHDSEKDVAIEMTRGQLGFET